METIGEKNKRELYITDCDRIDVLKALANETRIKILQLLEIKELNVHEIQNAIGCSKTTVLMHLNILETAGLISSYYADGTVGHQKFCKRTYDKFFIDIDKKSGQEKKDYYETLISPGNFSDFMIYPPCGLASNGGLIKRWDDPSAFFAPERTSAQLLWCSHGYVEYKIPLNIPYEDLGFHRIELFLELCPQKYIKDNRMLFLPESVPLESITDGVSDITFWIDEMEIGTYTTHSCTDISQRGQYTPSWWKGEQFGEQIHIVIDEKGCYINEQKVSDIILSDILTDEILKENLKMKLLMISSNCLTLRIGIKNNAKHKSGFCIFGHGFGNFSSDISIRWISMKSEN